MLTIITAIVVLQLVSFTSCRPPGDHKEPTYTVTYDGNGSTGGSVPVDDTDYEEGQTVTVLGNTGSLVKTGNAFAGWNTQAEGNGTTYTQSQTFAMGSEDVTLYARWTANPTYTVTYDGNGSTGGSVPVDDTDYEEGQTVTVLGNTGSLVKTGNAFAGWNTQADGLGATYRPGETFLMGTSDVTLYAKWLVCTEGLAYTLINGGTEYSVKKGTADTSGSVIIPEYWEGKKVTALGYQAFESCTSLTSVIIPDSVTVIDDYAFCSCTSLMSVTIGDSVTSIGRYAFYEVSLTSVTIPDSVTSISEGVFYDCTSLTSVTIGDSVTFIGPYAFRNCAGLTSVIIPDSVTVIGYGAFYECTGLTSVTIPAAVTVIDDSVFESCTSLMSVTIPDSVTVIGYGAFYGCVELVTVYVNATIPPALRGDYVFDNNRAGRMIYVPAGSVSNYQSAAYWSEYAGSIAAQ